MLNSTVESENLQQVVFGCLIQYAPHGSVPQPNGKEDEKKREKKNFDIQPLLSQISLYD